MRIPVKKPQNPVKKFATKIPLRKSTLALSPAIKKALALAKGPAYERGTRKSVLLDTAFRLAKEVGYLNLRRNMICDGAKISRGLITHHFKNMAGLHDEIIKRAIEVGEDKILAQGLIAGNHIALNAPDKLKKRAAMYLTKLKK